MKIFKNRQSAGKLLAKHLKHYKGKDNVLVLGIPRGGVVVAKEVARDLQLPLDILVTRKIGAPNQEELALGAVDPDGKVIWDEQLMADVGVKSEQLSIEMKNQLDEIKRREKEYRHERRSLPKLVGGKVIILVDDGIATGATTLSAINYLRRHGAKKIILAVPVASKEAVDKISGELGSPASQARALRVGELEKFGEVVVLETPEYFQAVGQFYHQFESVSDEEVVQLLSSRT